MCIDTVFFAVIIQCKSVFFCGYYFLLQVPFPLHLIIDPPAEPASGPDVAARMGLQGTRIREVNVAGCRDKVGDSVATHGWGNQGITVCLVGGPGTAGGPTSSIPNKHKRAARSAPGETDEEVRAFV